MRLDARIPVLVISPPERPTPTASSVLLTMLDPAAALEECDPGLGWAASRTLEIAQFEAEHQPGCTCCAGRSTLAVALGGLFTARAKAELTLFDRVVLSVPDRLGAAARRILCDDPLVAGRFRLTEKSNSASGNTC